MSRFLFVAHNRLVWLLIMLFLGVLADQASKIWVQKNLSEPYEITEEITKNGESFKIKRQVFYPTKVLEIIPNTVNFIYNENPAAAFSLTSAIPFWLRRPLLIAISVLAILLFLFWYLRMKPEDGILLFSFSFILTGAIGNLSDRLRLGYVIDFLDVYAGFLGYYHLHWPTFNIADSFIVVGAFGVIFRTLWPYKLKEVTE
jgi:signal peptidase II